MLPGRRRSIQLRGSQRPFTASTDWSSEGCFSYPSGRSRGVTTLYIAHPPDTRQGIKLTCSSKYTLPFAAQRRGVHATIGGAFGRSAPMRRCASGPCCPSSPLRLGPPFASLPRPSRLNAGLSNWLTAYRRFATVARSSRSLASISSGVIAAYLGGSIRRLLDSNTANNSMYSSISESRFGR